MFLCKKETERERERREVEKLTVLLLKQKQTAHIHTPYPSLFEPVPKVCSIMVTFLRARVKVKDYRMDFYFSPAFSPGLEMLREIIITSVAQSNPHF